MESIEEDDKDVKYCHCGNIMIWDIGNRSDVKVKYSFLTELRRDKDNHGEGRILYCKCCKTDVVRVDGVTTVADLDKASIVAIMDTIDANELRGQPTYSEIFKMVVPTTTDVDDDVVPDYPAQIQDTLDSAVSRQKATVQAQIADFTTEKKQEFKSWKDQARQQAKIIASVAQPTTSQKPTSIPNTALVIPQQTRPIHSPRPDLFQKSPLSSYTHPGASPLAAASLTRSYSEQKPSTPSPPLHKITPPPIPLSSSLKSPGNHNFGKPAKRVMFQDPPDDTAQSDMEDEIQETTIPILPPPSATISVDDELFDFDETIPSIANDSQQTLSNPSSPSQPVKSPLFAPPLSPFRRRTIEKYSLPDDEDEDPFNAVETEPPPELSSSYSKPIAITPPSRSFLAEGLGVDEDEMEEEGMKGLIERISLKNTRSRRKTKLAEQRMLWDIPGDFYRSVAS